MSVTSAVNLIRAKSPTLKKKNDTFSARRTKNIPFFGAPKAQTKIFAFFRDVLDWNIGYLVRAPKARAKF